MRRRRRGRPELRRGRVGLKPDLQIQRALAASVFLVGGAFERILAAGGELGGVFAQAHRLFDGCDLEVGDGGEAGFQVET